jgi:hypothetical protein
MEAGLPVALGGALIPLGRPCAGAALLVLGALLVVGTLGCPWAVRALRRALTRLAQRLGEALAWALLSASFWALFPLGRLFLLRGRDPLQRRFPGGQASYWQPAGDAREPRPMDRWF